MYLGKGLLSSGPNGPLSQMQGEEARVQPDADQREDWQNGPSRTAGSKALGFPHQTEE
jgi:hypothetical protein